MALRKKSFENIFRRGENAGYQHFFLFNNFFNLIKDENRQFSRYDFVACLQMLLIRTSLQFCHLVICFWFVLLSFCLFVCPQKLLHSFGMVNDELSYFTCGCQCSAIGCLIVDKSRASSAKFLFLCQQICQLIKIGASRSQQGPLNHNQYMIINNTLNCIVLQENFKHICDESICRS